MKSINHKGTSVRASKKRNTPKPSVHVKRKKYKYERAKPQYNKRLLVYLFSSEVTLLSPIINDCN